MKYHHEIHIQPQNTHFATRDDDTRSAPPHPTYDVTTSGVQVLGRVMTTNPAV